MRIILILVALSVHFLSAQAQNNTTDYNIDIYPSLGKARVNVRFDKSKLTDKGVKMSFAQYLPGSDIKYDFNQYVNACKAYKENGDILKCAKQRSYWYIKPVDNKKNLFGRLEYWVDLTNNPFVHLTSNGAIYYPITMIGFIDGKTENISVNVRINESKKSYYLGKEYIEDKYINFQTAPFKTLATAPIIAVNNGKFQTSINNKSATLVKLGVATKHLILNDKLLAVENNNLPTDEKVAVFIKDNQDNKQFLPISPTSKTIFIPIQSEQSDDIIEAIDNAYDNYNKEVFHIYTLNDVTSIAKTKRAKLSKCYWFYKGWDKYQSFKKELATVKDADKYLLNFIKANINSKKEIEQLLSPQFKASELENTAKSTDAAAFILLILDLKLHTLGFQLSTLEQLNDRISNDDELLAFWNGLTKNEFGKFHQNYILQQNNLPIKNSLYSIGINYSTLKYTKALTTGNIEDAITYDYSKQQFIVTSPELLTGIFKNMFQKGDIIEKFNNTKLDLNSAPALKAYLLDNANLNQRMSFEIGRKEKDMLRKQFLNVKVVEIPLHLKTELDYFKTSPLKFIENRNKFIGR